MKLSAPFRNILLMYTLCGLMAVASGENDGGITHFTLPDRATSDNWFLSNSNWSGFAGLTVSSDFLFNRTDWETPDESESVTPGFEHKSHHAFLYIAHAVQSGNFFKAFDGALTNGEVMLSVDESYNFLHEKLRDDLGNEYEFLTQGFARLFAHNDQYYRINYYLFANGNHLAGRFAKLWEAINFNRPTDRYFYVEWIR